MAKDKNPNGRPPKYSDTQTMENKINEYFDNCKPEYLKDEDGEYVISSKGLTLLNLNSPSLSGLALHLGHASRQSIYDNEDKELFSYILKKARTRVEEWVYQNAMSGSIHAAVGIFILKQFGYTDKQEVEHSGAFNVSMPPKDANTL